MTLEAVYRGVLMEHFQQPRNRGDLAGWEPLARVRNPLCGDEIAVGVQLEAGRLEAVRYQARACSICIASASLMSEAAGEGEALDPAAVLAGLERWLAEEIDRPEAVPERLVALAVVRPLPARHRCATLPWEALAAALGAGADERGVGSP